jgi:hypothetical protein
MLCSTCLHFPNDSWISCHVFSCLKWLRAKVMFIFVSLEKFFSLLINRICIYFIMTLSVQCNWTCNTLIIITCALLIIVLFTHLVQRHGDLWWSVYYNIEKKSVDVEEMMKRCDCGNILMIDMLSLIIVDSLTVFNA